MKGVPPGGTPLCSLKMTAQAVVKIASIRQNHRRKKRSGPQNPCDEQGPDGIGGLRDPVSDRRPTTAHRDQLFKIRLQTDGHETHAEKPVPVTIERTADSIDRFNP